MRKLIFACAMLGCSLAAPVAFADDCCYPAQCEPYCCGEGFDGFYIGGNVGAFTHVAHRTDRDGFFVGNGNVSHNDTNVTAGVLLGYDWQWCGDKLFGVVVDWNWVNTENRHRTSTIDTLGERIRSDFHWFTTIRARLGLTVCDALVYLTGGAAVARFRNEWVGLTDTFRDRHTRWGWTAGVGTELMLGCNWSVGAEILFLHFSEHRRSFSTGVTSFEFGHSDSAFIGRVILNYRFGDLFCCN